MKNKKVARSNAFVKAVKATEDIMTCHRPGLRALGRHSEKIALSQPTKCGGSVNIDECVREKYPAANRWDYVFSYSNKCYFVEVHTASTGEVSTVLRKLQWLIDWLNGRALKIKEMKAERPFYWIASNGDHILKSSSQYRQITQAGLKPISRLAL